MTTPDEARVADHRRPHAGQHRRIELTHRVVDRWPHMAIIVISSHAHLEAGNLPRGGASLSKPYAPATPVLMATSLVGPPIRQAGTVSPIRKTPRVDQASRGTFRFDNGFPL